MHVKYTSPLLLAAVLFVIVSLPPSLTLPWRTWVITRLLPLHGLAKPIAGAPSPVLGQPQLLQSQVQKLQAWLLHEQRIEQAVERWQRLMQQREGPNREFFQRRAREMAALLERCLKAVCGQVVYREPGSWSSHLWLNVGEGQNGALGCKIVAKGSPVLSGSSLVGIVDLVEQDRCRVRLITDASLTLFVRAVRGSQQDGWLYEELELLSAHLKSREDLFVSHSEAQALLHAMATMQQRLKRGAADFYGAKGELRGSGLQRLRGVGFNCDFADEEGPARELHTGLPLTTLSTQAATPLVKVGDLLITSGLDGILPPGLRVATVCKVQPLGEGAASCDLEALPNAGNLEELHTLIVLPAESGNASGTAA